MVDIDILLGEGTTALESARNSLSSIGLTLEKVSHIQGEWGDHGDLTTGRAYKFQYIFGGRPLGVDLHLAVGTGGFVYMPGPAIARRALRARIGSSSVMLTSPEDTLLVTCANSLGNGRFIARDLMDAISVVSGSRHRLDWRSLLELSRALSLEVPVSSLLYLAELLLSGPSSDDARLKKEIEDFRERILTTTPRTSRGAGSAVLDGSRFGVGSDSLSLKAYRDRYFLPSKLGRAYPVRSILNSTREMMREWAREGSTSKGLQTFLRWKTREMIQEAARRLSREREIQE